jgi:hypothetical protein
MWDITTVHDRIVCHADVPTPGFTHHAVKHSSTASESASDGVLLDSLVTIGYGLFGNGEAKVALDCGLSLLRFLSGACKKMIFFY